MKLGNVGARLASPDKEVGETSPEADHSQKWKGADLEHAEWYAWAKREISADEMSCQGIAVVAREASEAGLPEREIRRLARASMLGKVTHLARTVPEARQQYAQWYDWARLHVKGESSGWHEAATKLMEATERDLNSEQAIGEIKGRFELSEDPYPLPDSSSRGEGSLVGPKHIVVPPAPTKAKQLYAGFGLRLAAYLIDIALLMGVFLVLAIGTVLFLFLTGDGSANANGLWSFVLGLGILLMWLYRAGMESSYLQATIGKRIMGVVVVDSRGERISFLRATLRFAFEIVSTLPFFLGYLMALATRRRLTLHDHLARTMVIRREYAEVAGAAAAYLHNPSPEVPSSGHIGYA